LKNLIIFDLDGVITSEEAYWDAAGLTLHELLYSPRYWNLTGDTRYQPAATARVSRAVSRATFPEWLIMSFKARALNSNWDTCYAAVCLHLVALLSHLPHRADLRPLRLWDMAWLAMLRRQMAAVDLAISWHLDQLLSDWQEAHPFDLPVFRGATGLELFERMDAYAEQVLGFSADGAFSRKGLFWSFCQDRFQEWLLGDELYTETYGRAPLQPGKPGCIYFEEPLLPVEQIREALGALREQGYVLGVATGRVRLEAAKPLEKYDLLHYFDEQHMGTYDLVTRAEEELRKRGGATMLLQYPQTDRDGGKESLMLPLAPADVGHSTRETLHRSKSLMLGKPHPFHFEAAVDWEKALHNAQSQAPEPLDIPFIAVGDSTSDILSGEAAGALTVAVLSGARTPEARERLLKSQPHFVVEDIRQLPGLLVQFDSLSLIQKLQFKRLETAEKLLRLWFARHMDLSTESVHLTPRAVSLNSFNGFYRSKGKEFFFKTHVEAHGVIDEYYHAQLLEKAGYNVVSPLHLLREKGRQMVIYPVVKWPVMFDLVRAAETGQELPPGVTEEELLAAESQECQRLLRIYAETFEKEANTSDAPVHQLFWHRLTGGRFRQFYLEKDLALPVGDEVNGTELQDAVSEHNSVSERGTGGREVPAKAGQDPINRPSITGAGNRTGGGDSIAFERLRDLRWVVNGVEQRLTLGELVEQAKVALDPARRVASVVGHGDAHFGNVFLEDAGKAGRYLYFDPAFAGRHSPLLDVVKPLYHNVFATWMYFPREVAQDLRLAVKLDEERVVVEHTYRLTPVRRALLHIKQRQLLAPLLAWLRELSVLPEDWQSVLNLALMCCPLLTIDLFDRAKVPPEISWLGLSQAVQLGNRGIEPWLEEEQ